MVETGEEESVRNLLGGMDKKAPDEELAGGWLSG
jgi:hypothetical protein